MGIPYFQALDIGFLFQFCCYRKMISTVCKLNFLEFIGMVS